MLKLTKGSTSTIICTLAERVSIVGANFLFVFTSRATNDEVKFVLLNLNDLSTNTDRWNEWQITVNTYFSASAPGWYTYQVYEQLSTTNTDVSLSGAMIEKGLMFLTDSTTTTFTQYSQDINFTIYDAG